MSLAKIEAGLRRIPDFPKPGIVYIDITPLLQDNDLFANVIDLMSEKYIDNPPKYIVGIEARGCIVGSAMAYKLGRGFIPIRKKGKLPHKTILYRAIDIRKCKLIQLTSGSLDVLYKPITRNGSRVDNIISSERGEIGADVGSSLYVRYKTLSCASIKL